MEVFGSVLGECHLGTKKQFGFHALIINSYGNTLIVKIKAKEWRMLKEEFNLIVEG